MKPSQINKYFLILVSFAFATSAFSQYRVKNTHTVSENQVAQYALTAGFDRELIPLVTCLVKKESNFNPMAINNNVNGTTDYGLMQVNSLWEKPCHMSAQDLKNPLKNMKCAFKVYKNQGMSAWVTFQKFNDECRQYQLTDVNFKLNEKRILLVENNQKI